ncbi:hypothetical protein SAMN05892877_110200 [Rhizobium subbaraonis]|uniref:Uncharacterized protein n=1 Tax=Rhizobium subbaraonis TaxID=908946 RepID=A0A285UM49_9HYPH|nr:hypothetical protein SAMN05892877_110200 [Rhizobium subbaraonis]
MRGWVGHLEPVIGSDDMNHSGPDPRDKAERHGSRSGAPALRDHAGVGGRPPIIATEARRQPEAWRNSDHIDGGRNFVGSITEFDDP